MTPEEIQTIVNYCRYEPWKIVLRRDTIMPEHSEVGLTGRGGRTWHRLYIQVRDDNGKCNVTGKPKPWGGRKWFVSPHMTETEIVKTCLNAVIAAQTHETLEKFEYKGWAIFDPHIRVSDLVLLRATKPLDGRTESDGSGYDCVGPSK